MKKHVIVDLVTFSGEGVSSVGSFAKGGLKLLFL